MMSPVDVLFFQYSSHAELMSKCISELQKGRRDFSLAAVGVRVIVFLRGESSSMLSTRRCMMYVTAFRLGCGRAIALIVGNHLVWGRF